MAGNRSLGQALEHHSLKERICELESQLKDKEHKVVEVIKHIYIEVPKEIAKEVKVLEEKATEVVKEINVIEEKFIEIEKFIDREIHIIPKWVFGIIAIETLLIIVLLIK